MIGFNGFKWIWITNIRLIRVHEVGKRKNSIKINFTEISNKLQKNFEIQVTSVYSAEKKALFATYFFKCHVPLKLAI